MRFSVFMLGVSAMFVGGAAYADTTVVPASSLTSSGNYYTDNIGDIVVMTGGGNAPGIGNPSGRNDDGFSGPIDLGFNFTLYGNTYSSLYINNNGNVSFGAGISAYVPTGPTGANAPLVSVFFGDVDTRGANSGVVHYQLDTPGQLIVTWDNVGRYNGRSDLLNSFQLVLRSDDFVIPTNEGQIGFFYKNMGWDQTDTSQVAAIGFGDGAGNATILEGSLSSGLNRVVQNKYIWFNANLEPVPSGVPEPTTWAMMLIGFGVVGVSMRRRQRVRVAFA
ncbi:MAG: PEPxxWA-CTERM sorting domain-containing protein [Sphingomonas sp.]|nr:MULTISPECIES: nidogen-like domain-containing protein [Sphingomonas]MDX3882856.1 PEPxxWA-CTERM sorting domain-containing protein [Sphingomonas sp.]